MPKETSRTMEFVCTGGRHRSVGWSLLVRGIFEEMGFEELALKLFPNNPARLCQECVPCAAETPHWNKDCSQIYQEAAAIFARTSEDLGFWW